MKVRLPAKVTTTTATTYPEPQHFARYSRIDPRCIAGALWDLGAQSAHCIITRRPKASG